MNGLAITTLKILIRKANAEALSVRDGDFSYTSKTWTRTKIVITNTKDIQISKISNQIRSQITMAIQETMDLIWSLNQILAITMARVTKILEEEQISNLTGGEIKAKQLMITYLKMKIKISVEVGLISKLTVKARMLLLIRIVTMDLATMGGWILTLIDLGNLYVISNWINEWMNEPYLNIYIKTFILTNLKVSYSKYKIIMNLLTRNNSFSSLINHSYLLIS